MTTISATDPARADAAVLPAPPDPLTDHGAPATSGLEYRWVAMGVVLFGTFMVVLDTTIVNLALPSIQQDFRIEASVEWVVTAYLIAVGVIQMMSGWVGDRFGRRRAFIGSLAVFTVGSALCAVAPTLWTLVAARVVQGIGGGLLMPIAMTIIYELFEPSERGRALGYYGIAVMAAPAIGPVLGGSLVSSVGWRWLFLVNVPIGLVAIPVAVRLLRESGAQHPRPLDRLGLLLATPGLVMLLMGLQQSGVWGWSSAAVVSLLACGGALLAAFAWWSLRTPTPLVEVRLFGNPVFSLSLLAVAFVTIAQFARLVFIPLELGGARDVSAVDIGFVLLPAALGMALMLPLGGRLADRVGSRTPFVAGSAILAASFWPLAHLDTDSSLTYIAAILFVGGLGAGLAMMAPSVVAMNSVRATQVAQASGLSSVTRQVSAALGTAVFASIFASAVGDGVATGSVDPYNRVFLVAFWLLVATTLLGLALPGRSRALSLQKERLEERAELRTAGVLAEA
jgi:DHA2 family multidrug resistance protein